MEEQKKKKKIASKIVDIILGALIVLILGLQIDMFITKNNNSNNTIAAIYQLQKEKKLRNISFRKIHEALNADISSIKAYNTLSPLYNSFERLMKITSAKEIDYKFQKEEKKRAQKIFDLMAFFVSTYPSDTFHHGTGDEAKQS